MGNQNRQPEQSNVSIFSVGTGNTTQLDWVNNDGVTAANDNNLKTDRQPRQRRDERAIKGLPLLKDYKS
jgi:hypothetical protein